MMTMTRHLRALGCSSEQTLLEAILTEDASSAIWQLLELRLVCRCRRLSERLVTILALVLVLILTVQASAVAGD
jgi:hypothetical protein